MQQCAAAAVAGMDAPFVPTNCLIIARITIRALQTGSHAFPSFPRAHGALNNTRSPSRGQFAITFEMLEKAFATTLHPCMLLLVARPFLRLEHTRTWGQFTL